MNRVLSIYRTYAERIVEGTKQFELRKRNLGIAPGDTVFLYEVVPDCRIAGGFIALDTLVLPVDEMWCRYHHILGIDEQSYRVYFAESIFAYGTKVGASFPLTPISSDSLIKLNPGFSAPQSTLIWREVLPDEWNTAKQKALEFLHSSGKLPQQMTLW